MNSFDQAEWKNEIEIVAHCVGEPRGCPSWGEHIVGNINGTNGGSYWLHFTSRNHLKGINDAKRCYYVFPCVEPGLWPSRKRVRLHSSTLGYATTAQLAIQVALYMGFGRIVLLGFDHDWLASPKYSRHFYSNDKDGSDIIGTLNYLDIIEMGRRMWTIYYKLKGIARSHGATIYNMTKDSYLDVFERIDSDNTGDARLRYGS